MNKHNLSYYCLNIGIISFLLKILLIGTYMFIYMKQVQNLQVLSFLIHCVSILALIGLLLFFAGVVKKQWGWKLFVGLILNLLALVLYPLVYAV